MPAAPTFALDSPPPGAGWGGAALAVLTLHAASADALARIARAIRIAPLPAPGAITLRAALGNAECIVARPTVHSAILTPLASPIVLEAIIATLTSAGCAQSDALDPRARYPEAQDLIEACAVDTLARAPSSRAIDILLDQRAAWRDPASPLSADPNPLDHLLRPPRIVVVGRPNIGKSTLLNAMARRAVAIVADEPGATRDHIGADLDCDGLRVHWIDTPGIPSPGAPPLHPLDAHALERARPVIAAADLILRAVDPRAGAVDRAELPPLPASTRILSFAIRADLGLPAEPVPLRTAASFDRGLPELALAIRRALVPDAILTSPAKWRFHPALPAT